MRKELKASKKYWFVWNEVLDLPCAFDSFLFNETPHLAMQPSKNCHSYYLLEKYEDIIYARCTFFIESDTAYSPHKSSFGSIEWGNQLFFEPIDEFWNYVEEDLKEKGVKKITIKNYPTCYHPENAQFLFYLFYTKGFSLKTHELNFHIEVDDIPFEEKIHKNEKRKLRRCLQKPYQVRKEENSDSSKVYAFIDTSRKRKNYPTTLNEKELKLLLEHFPDRFAVYSISYENDWAALCVTIKVNDIVLYTFYAADNEAYSKDSPLVLLHYHLYLFSKKNGIRIMDLGIGTSEGIPNKGLIRFKQEIGGKYSSKMSFIKTIP